MVSTTLDHYLERTVTVTHDTLGVISELVSSGLHDDYVVYERPGQWCYAGGALAQITLDRTGARLTGPEEVSLPWSRAPLDLVEQLTRRIPVSGWRCYGWAAFELAYAKDGDRSQIGAQRLLHLLVPRTEIRVSAGRAVVRAADERSLAAAVAALASVAAHGDDSSPAPIDVRATDSGAYREAVADAVRRIDAGDLQKVILSRTVPLHGEIDLVGTYAAGRRANTPARSFLLRLDGLESAGFSPEVVTVVEEGGRVAIQPLAGTRALTSNHELNAALRSELVTDPKEIYEHAISVKIAWDDLAEVCESESLTVEEFMAVRERGTVQHLASRVAGRLAPGRGPWHAFAAAFPAVTASGVPKSAAYPAIRDLEQRARGLYSGSVLTVDEDGTLDAALVLRAVYRQNGSTWLQAGAGIVGASQPAREFEETCEKLDSVARHLVAPGPGPGSTRPGRVAAKV